MLLILVGYPSPWLHSLPLGEMLQLSSPAQAWFIPGPYPRPRSTVVQGTDQATGESLVRREVPSHPSYVLQVYIVSELWKGDGWVLRRLLWYSTSLASPNSPNSPIAATRGDLVGV